MDKKHTRRQKAKAAGVLFSLFVFAVVLFLLFAVAVVATQRKLPRIHIDTHSSRMFTNSNMV